MDEMFSGGSICSDVIYELLQCSQCRDVKSVGLTFELYKAHDFPLSECCHAKMRLWDVRCPRCGTMMDKEFLYDDF